MPLLSLLVLVVACTAAPTASLLPTPHASTAASATPGPAVTASPSVAPTLPPVRAVDVPTGWGHISAEGDFVVWSGPPTLYSGTGPAPYLDTVFVHDLRTATTRRIARTTFPAGQLGRIFTDGRWVVWTDLETFTPSAAGDWRIFAYDLQSNASFEVARNATPGRELANMNFPWPEFGLGQGRVAWDEDYAANGKPANRLLLLDLATKSRRMLVDTRDDGLLQPTIFGKRVAFVRVAGAFLGTPGRPTVTVIDLDSGLEQVPAPDRPGFQPNLSRDLLVWKGGDLGQWGDVVLHDFRIARTTVLVQQDADLPSVGTRYVTWQPSGFDRVPVYDTREGALLSAGQGSVGRSIAQGDFVAWVSVDQPHPNWRGSIKYIIGRP